MPGARSAWPILSHRENTSKAPSRHLGAGTLFQSGKSTANKTRKVALGGVYGAQWPANAKRKSLRRGRGNAELAKLALVE